MAGVCLGVTGDGLGVTINVKKSDLQLGGLTSQVTLHINGDIGCNGDLYDKNLLAFLLECDFPCFHARCFGIPHCTTYL